jgi:hypothetical protein
MLCSLDVGQIPAEIQGTQLLPTARFAVREVLNLTVFL